jgi:hypothetical protein
MRKITVNISQTGGVHMDAQGFKGKSCEEATDMLMVMIGGEGESKKKPEYFQPPTSTAVGIKKVF